MPGPRSTITAGSATKGRPHPLMCPGLRQPPSLHQPHLLHVLIDASPSISSSTHLPFHLRLLPQHPSHRQLLTERFAALTHSTWPQPSRDAPRRRLLHPGHLLSCRHLMARLRRPCLPPAATASSTVLGTRIPSGYGASRSCRRWASASSTCPT